MNKSDKTHSRRQHRRHSLKSLGTGAVLAGTGEYWFKPVVRSIVLPAHANTSADGFVASCEINFSRQMHATGNPQLLQALKSGTSPQDTDIAGTYSGVMPGAESSKGDCTETQIGFDTLPVTITVEQIT